MDSSSETSDHDDYDHLTSKLYPATSTSVKSEEMDVDATGLTGSAISIINQKQCKIRDTHEKVAATENKNLQKLDDKNKNMEELSLWNNPRVLVLIREVEQLCIARAAVAKESMKIEQKDVKKKRKSVEKIVTSSMSNYKSKSHHHKKQDEETKKISPLFSSINNKKSSPPPTEEARVVSFHEAEIENINQRLNILSKGKGNKNSNTLLTIDALKSQRKELLQQKLVYDKVKAKAELQLKGLERELQLKRELYRFKSRLPALAHRIEIEDRMKSIDKSRFIIIQGQTGSGKSSQIAQYVADFLPVEKKVLCTQPRKIAAISLAERVSKEYSGGGGGGVKPLVGDKVGYHVGGRKMTGKNCRIQFITEGVMLEKIMRGSPKPFQDVGCIIIDEAHERSVICDILLGCFKKEDDRWKDIFIIITSATIDLVQFSDFFNNSKPVEIAGRTYPVDIVYEPISENADIRTAVVNTALKIHHNCKNKQGDILCFLPGENDVLNAQDSFEAKANKIGGAGLLGTKVFALFGKQDPELQAEVFKALPCNTRKVIFATDVAETSITIDGVVYVVDSGVKKEMTFDPKRNISSLKIQTISKSSAIQRAGRSGRTQPGQCFRLYSLEDYESMDINTAPEVFRKPLALPILSLHDMGISPLEFDWISKPSLEAIEAAEIELKLLGAIDSGDNGYRPTELGKLISFSQQDPKVVRMVHRGCQLGLATTAITIASILSVSNIFFWNGNDDASKEASTKRRNDFAKKDGDIVTMFRVFEHWRNIREGNSPPEPQDDAGPEQAITEEVPKEASITEEIKSNEIEDKPIEEIPPDENLPDFAPIHNEDEDLMTFDDIDEVKLDTVNVKPHSGTPNVETFIDVETVNIAILGLPSASAQSLIQPKAEEKKPQKYGGAKVASEWCRNNYINGKAMNLIHAMNFELNNIFKSTKCWKLHDNQSKVPTDDDIRRLIFSGYFLHSARRIQSKNTRSIQYYAIQSESTGNLDNKSAIVNIHRNKKATDTDSAASSDIELPIWIIFDKILRLSLTLFPTSSVIEESWLREESQEFSELCQRKCLTLPTERLEFPASQECIRMIFGKFCRNRSDLEDELSCTLEPDGRLGLIHAFCSERAKSWVKLQLNKKIEDTVKLLRIRVVEEDYQNGTRALIGLGYEVTDILFPEEFATIFLRKLPNSLNNTKILLSRLQDFKIQQSTILSLEIKEHDNSNGKFAVLNFYDKNVAKEAYRTLRGELKIGENLIEVVAGKGNTAMRKYRQGGECIRLKMSWALMPSIGKCTLSFTTADDANICIQQMDSIFFGSLVSAVHGDRVGVPSKAKVQNRQMPTVTPIPGYKGAKRYRFVQDAGAELDYRITVVNLSNYIDEAELMSKLSHCKPKWAKVERLKESPAADNEPPVQAMSDRQIQITNRVYAIDALKNSIDKNTFTKSFIENHLNRGGLRISFDDRKVTEKVFDEISKELQENVPLWTYQGQPIRIELEYSKSTSIHTDLFEYLKKDIESIMASARKDNLLVSQTKPNPQARVKWIILRFQHHNTKLLESYQKQIDAVLRCEKFSAENKEVLFTWTGKQLMEIMTELYFFHWNPRNQELWIYGNESQREAITLNLLSIIGDLSTLEIDVLLTLDKKKMDLTKPKEKGLIEKTCKQGRLYHYYFRGRNQLFVTGKKDIIESFRSLLTDKGFLLQYPIDAAGSERRKTLECGVCLDTVESNFILLSDCNHPFCVTCLEAMFKSSGAVEVPIKCPTCNNPMVINDILKLAPPGSMRKFLETSIFEYQGKHQESIIVCPKPGCNQMLSVEAGKKGQHGGNFHHCIECLTTYCVDCCKVLAKVVESHEGDSCDDIQNGLSDGVMKHVRHVQEEIFNLKCPKCKKAFFDFTGCAAVRCESCGCAFCGACLHDCGTDAHSHVMSCTFNPTGTFYITNEQLNVIHKNKRNKELNEYINSISDETEERQKVMRALRRDIADLGLTVNC